MGEDVTTESGAGSDQATGGRGVTPAAQSDADRSGLDSAPRRTLLAAERTYLAWLRTGLGAIGVSLAVGRLVPVLLGSSHFGYALLGVGYGLLGIFLIAYALLRARRLQTVLDTGERMTLDWWALTIVTAAGLALAVGTIAMVLAEV